MADLPAARLAEADQAYEYLMTHRDSPTVHGWLTSVVRDIAHGTTMQKPPAEYAAFHLVRLAQVLRERETPRGLTEERYPGVRRGE